MDVRDVGAALWRQRPLVVLVLLVTGGAVAAGILLALDGGQTPASDAFSSPDLRLSLGLGLLLALGLATAAAVWRDRRIHTVDDAAAVEDAASAPLLAHLTPPQDLTSMPALAPGTAEADLFRHLRLALETQADDGSPRVVVAAVTHGDVNVWIGANVALALAGTGRRVLLVDGRMGERFGTPVENAPDTPGLYDVLLGAELETAMSPGPVDLLQVLPAGTYGDVAITELITQRFPALMDSVATEFDNIVVIGPPLDVCDDSRAMAVDGSMVLALVEGSVSANALRLHADRIRAVSARLLGVVLVARAAERRVA
jgi:succinoglycan biosynthesis transport protein ExoP